MITSREKDQVTKKDPTIYDETDYYEKKIVPVIKKLEAKCKKQSIPLFISVAVSNIDGITHYENRGYASQATSADPTEFRIVRDKKGNLVFDNEAFYKKECAPLAQEVINVCTQRAIPVFVSAVVASSENNTVYMNNAFMTGSSDIHLYDDKFRYYLEIAGGGFKAVPNHFVQVVDMSDFSSLFHDDHSGSDDEDE